jgi:anti-sigma regulatory factor (Ser/Thr protein kinase)
MSAEDTMAAERIIELRFAAAAENLRVMRAAVEHAARLVGCSESIAKEVVIAVNEACMNIIQHGYRWDRKGEIVLEILNNSGTLTVLLRDDAEAVVAERIRPRALDDVRPGGLGTHFIRTLMDEFEVTPGDEGRGNVWRLSKIIC